MSIDPFQVAQHVELDTAGGLVYALIEDWRPHAEQPSRKVLALQPANGSGEPGGQACVPERHELHSPVVDRLVKRYPELAAKVEEARAAQPEPAPVPTLTSLADQVERLTALLEQGVTAEPAHRQRRPAGPPAS